MEILRPILEWATNEHLKTAAALIQAVGVLIGAVLAYFLGKKLEQHKYDMRLKEIIHSNTQKRRLETLENLSVLTGKLVFEMRDIAPNLGSPKPTVEILPGESREDWLRRFFQERTNTFNAACLELYQAEESGSIYLLDELQRRLEAFRIESIATIDRYIPAMLEKYGNSSTYGTLGNDFVAGCERMKQERRAIVKEISTFIEI